MMDKLQFFILIIVVILLCLQGLKKLRGGIYISQSIATKHKNFVFQNYNPGNSHSDYIVATETQNTKYMSKKSVNDTFTDVYYDYLSKENKSAILDLLKIAYSSISITNEQSREFIFNASIKGGYILNNFLNLINDHLGKIILPTTVSDLDFSCMVYSKITRRRIIDFTESNNVNTPAIYSRIFEDWCTKFICNMEKLYPNLNKKIQHILDNTNDDMKKEIILKICYNNLQTPSKSTHILLAESTKVFFRQLKFEDFGEMYKQFKDNEPLNRDHKNKIEELNGYVDGIFHATKFTITSGLRGGPDDAERYNHVNFSQAPDGNGISYLYNREDSHIVGVFPVLVLHKNAVSIFPLMRWGVQVKVELRNITNLYNINILDFSITKTDHDIIDSFERHYNFKDGHIPMRNILSDKSIISSVNIPSIPVRDNIFTFWDMEYYLKSDMVRMLFCENESPLLNPKFEKRIKRLLRDSFLVKIIVRDDNKASGLRALKTNKESNDLLAKYIELLRVSIEKINTFDDLRIYTSDLIHKYKIAPGDIWYLVFTSLGRTTAHYNNPSTYISYRSFLQHLPNCLSDGIDLDKQFNLTRVSMKFTTKHLYKAYIDTTNELKVILQTVLMDSLQEHININYQRPQSRNILNNISHDTCRSKIAHSVKQVTMDYNLRP